MNWIEETTEFTRQDWDNIRRHMIHLVSYASPGYEHLQRDLSSQARSFGISCVHEYTQDWLRKQPVYFEHRDVFDAKRGAGFWAWKPVIILDVMYNHASENDMVIYLDSSTSIEKDPTEIILSATDSVTSIQSEFPCKIWTKRDCFILMSCDEEEYWNANEVWAGCIIAKKSQRAKIVLEHWLLSCLDYDIIGNDPGVNPNFPGFVEHREDQSILSLLVIKYGLKTFTTDVFRDRC